MHTLQQGLHCVGCRSMLLWQAKVEPFRRVVQKRWVSKGLEMYMLCQIQMVTKCKIGKNSPSPCSLKFRTAAYGSAYCHQLSRYTHWQANVAELEKTHQNLKRNNTTDTPLVNLISFNTDMFKKHFRKTVNTHLHGSGKSRLLNRRRYHAIKRMRVLLTKNVAKWITLQTYACITCDGLLAQWAYRAA